MQQKNTVPPEEMTREQLLALTAEQRERISQLEADIHGFVQEHATMLLLADRMVSESVTLQYQASAREMFAWDRFFVVCLQLDTALQDWDGARNARSGPGDYALLRSLLAALPGIGVWPAMLYDKQVCIVNLDAAGRTQYELEQVLKTAFSALNAQLLAALGRSARISISSCCSELGELPGAYRQCLRLIEHRRTYGDGGQDILLCDDVLTSALDFEQAQPAGLALPALIKRAIEAQFKNPMLNINYLADQFNVSPSYITRTFRSRFGIRPWEYIQRLRIREAKELLERGAAAGITAKSAAEKSGFGTSANMIRIFKRFEGITPGDLRTQMAGSASAEN